MIKINNHIEVSTLYEFDNNFTNEQLDILKEKDPYIYQELGRQYFWTFCQQMAPEFYNLEHGYLKYICDFFQGTWEDDQADYMAISIPPQHGKSRTAFLFALWHIIKDKTIRIFNISYNEDYAIEASINLLREIAKTGEDGTTVAQNYANLELQRGEAAKKKWTIQGGRATWLSSSYYSGAVTGKSAQLVLLDDLIKSYKVSVNRTEKRNINTFISGTLLSRRSGKFKIYIPQTRWAKDDPIGFFLDTEPNKTKQLIMKAYDPINDTMLCSAILDREGYDSIIRVNKKNNTLEVVEANYNQAPVDVKGVLINRYNKWDKLPDKLQIKETFSVTDTSDTGSDYFASLCFAKTRDGKLYALDLVYDSAPVEETIPALVSMISKNGIYKNVLESNNGGRVIALDVKEGLKKENAHALVKWFHQSNNKETRILNNSAKIMDLILWPPDFDTPGSKWEVFREDFVTFQKEFSNNEHDDALDVATMAIEYSEGRLKTK